MNKPSRRKTQIAALSASISIAFSGAAFAAWNPLTGQASPAPANTTQPAASTQDGASSQAITIPALSSNANPNAKPLNDGSGAGPSGGGTLGMGAIVKVVKGYGFTPDIATQSGMNQFYNFVVDASKQIYGELHAIYNYLAYGIVENTAAAGKGLIGTINKNHDLDRVALEEQFALNHARMQELMMKQAYANKVVGQVQDYRACDDIVVDSLARSANGGGAYGRGSGSSAAKGETEAAVAKSSAGGTMSEISTASKIYAEHKADGYCSKEDVFYSDGKKRNAFDCEKPGEMPDGDSRAQSIFAPAHDYTNPSVVAKQTLTFGNGGKHKKAADASIRNIVSAFSPPALPKDAESTDAGKLYQGKTKVFNARVSSAVHALAAMADRRIPGDIGSGATSTSGGSSFFSWGGDKWKTVYARIFKINDADVPEKLSEADSLRFEAYLRYYDNSTLGDSWYTQKVEDGEGDDLVKEQLRMGAVEMLMLYNIHQRLEENNMIQAAILSHMINPITKSDIEQTGRSASKNR